MEISNELKAKLDKQQKLTKEWSRLREVYWPRYEHLELSSYEIQAKMQKYHDAVSSIATENKYYRELNQKHRYGYNKSWSPYAEVSTI
jgi:hypothetical protein